MAQLSLLAIVQRACGEMGLQKPAAVIGNTADDTALQMLDLANRIGEDLRSFGDWSFLTVEGATISLVAGQELYPLPADFDRLVADTAWDRTNKWRTFGPDTASEARWRRESTVSQVGPRRAIRQVGSNISVWPVPAASGDVIAYDYVSSNFAVSRLGVSQSAFLADTDTALFANDIMVQGLKWRWREEKGFDASGAERDFRRNTARAFARDQGGGRVLNMGARPSFEGNCDDVVASSPVVTLSTSGGLGIAVD